MKYLASHNNADLQAEVLAEVRQHVAANRVIQGTYGDEHGACFIGCLANGENDKGTVTERTGWPPVLIGIAENIFEGLPPSDSPAFFYDALHAPRLGADLSLVAWQFLHAEVRDLLAAHGAPKIRKGCAPALDVLSRLAQGAAVSTEEAHDAAEAAYVAATADDATNIDALTANVAGRAARAASWATDIAAKEKRGATLIAALEATDAADATECAVGTLVAFADPEDDWVASWAGGRLRDTADEAAAGVDAYEAATKKQAARLIQFLKAA